MLYQFHGRLKANPQTRVNSDENCLGFMSLAECEEFCRSIFFNFIIFHRENGKKVYDMVVE